MQGDSRVIICSFSSPAAELPRGRRTPDQVLICLASNPRVSTFDMSEKRWLWRSVKSLLADKLIEEIKESYPWHRYRLTDAGRAALKQQGT